MPSTLELYKFLYYSYRKVALQGKALQGFDYLLQQQKVYKYQYCRQHLLQSRLFLFNLTFAPQLLRSLLTVILAGQLITGAILTTTVPYPAGLVQPPTFCVTEYVPAQDTVIGFVDAPVFHNMVVPGSVDSPSAVSVEVPL